MIRNPLFYILLLCSSPVLGQVGGRHAYEFLNVPGYARLAALGGVNVSRGGDVSFFHANPALLADSLSNWASVSYRAMPANIGVMNASYAINLKKAGVIGVGIHHINYGSIQGYDPSGVSGGKYTSSETALIISKSHKVNNFQLGATLKGVFSTIAGYRSSALMTDIGGIFHHPNGRLTAGLVIKNLGVVLSDYSQTSHSSIPFDVQAGVTLKPEFMPIRFSFTAHNLVRPSEIYYAQGSDTKPPGTLDKLLRHFNFAAEILLHKNFNVLAGYNFLIHQDLKFDTGGAGFTIGMAVRVKSFELILSRGSYVRGNAGYTFTLVSDLNRLLKR